MRKGNGQPRTRLEAWRQRLGITQVEAAEVVGVDQGRYSQYERGVRKPGRMRAVRIEQATGGYVTVESWEGEPTRKAS